MKANEFEKEEYLTLRKEIETHISEIGQLERNCVLASGLTYAWLAKDSSDFPLIEFAWYIPILFSFFGAIRSASLGFHILDIGKYIHRIEEKIFSDQDKNSGWEHYIKKNSRRKMRACTDIVFWVVFNSVTIIVGIIM